MHVGIHHAHSKHFHSHIGNKPKEVIARFMDRGVYVMGAVAVGANIPQFMTVVVNKNVAGVSIISWTGFLLGSLFWMGYGIVHKQKPITVINAMLVCVQVGIVAGILFH